MSAIISGWHCKSCDKKFSISFGHPKWWDDVVKRGLPKSEKFLIFEKIAKSGKCITCWIKEDTEDDDKLQERLKD